MCGIAGVIYSDPQWPVDHGVLHAMGNSIAHRGPDAEGIWAEPGIGIVHRRLSIIDLSGGNQPIGNEDGSVQVVQNGEIYNFESLRSGLERKGHIFRTRSDTEVIAHLYEDEGEQFAGHLRGMFAIAIWDRRSRRLVLARDRIGIKPMYLYRDADKLVFGSELKAILAHPGIDRKLDAAGLENYLTYGMVPGPGSIFKAMEKLPPAHVLVASADALDRKPSRYWQLRFEPDERLGVDEWEEAIRAKVDETVRHHLIADVPVGAFLSGGLDSSIVVATSARISREPLQTFSIGFLEESFSELPFARQVSGQFGTRHVEKIVTPDAVSLLEDLTRFFDEPFADSSAIPTFLVARLARQAVKVALSGDGGDEAFGGYARYAHDMKEAAVRRHLPIWFRRSVLGRLGQVWPKADWLPRPFRAKTALTNLALDAGAAYANTLSVCRQPLRRRLLGREFVDGLDGHDPERCIREHHSAVSPADALAGMLAADTSTILPDDFLVKVDRASMAHGLEVRPPFLDHELMELAARIPSRWKVHGGETKWILKKAYESQLPASVVRRRKQGFELPIDAWLRGPLRGAIEETVLSPNSRVAGLIDQTTARDLYRAHVSGIGRHGGVLWQLLVLAHWANRYLGPI